MDFEPGVWLERESFGNGCPMGGGLEGGQLLIKGAANEYTSLKESGTSKGELQGYALLATLLIQEV